MDEEIEKLRQELINDPDGKELIQLIENFPIEVFLMIVLFAKKKAVEK